MSSLRNRRFKSLFKILKNGFIGERPTKNSAASNSEQQLPGGERGLQNPVYAYYEDMLKRSLASFSQFALQSRSLDIRSIFARVASLGRQDLVGLLAEIDWCSNHLSRPQNFRGRFDSEVLLALADLLSNSARDDLDTYASIRVYDFVRALFGIDIFSDVQRLQYLEALNEAGRYSDVDDLWNCLGLDSLAPTQYKLLLNQRVVSTETNAASWLESINGIYDDLGMSKIALLDDESLPILDRLTSTTRESIDGPKVSVIIPTYCPGEGIWTAVRSLTEQTWNNLEIIIVDDASPEEYENIFASLESADARIRVIRQHHNSGSYVARNTGLAIANGQYVTTHDDDDWSHPEKIARQVSALSENEKLVATASSHIRTTPEMVFKRVNKKPVFMQLNYSSLMFRRTLVDEIGNWDTVNRSGDAEFLMRIISNFGKSTIAELPSWPLSFSRVWEGSLTSGEMARGFHAYSRVLYRWAFRQWQLQAVKLHGKAKHRSEQPRQFPRPSNLTPGMRSATLGMFDVIFVTDFFRQSKFADIVLDEMQTLSEEGFRIGYMHISSPQTIKRAGFLPRLFELQLHGDITQVSHDDTAETRLLIVFDPAIGMFLDEFESSLVSQRSILVDRHMASLKGANIRSPTLMGQALQNLDLCFGSRFEVVGSTSQEQGALERQVPVQRILRNELLWRPHLREKPSTPSEVSGVPVVGFHSYGNSYRWPSTAVSFESVYVSSKYRTHLYGNTDVVLQKYSQSISEDLELISAKDRTESEFLEEIDFWVYYPHPRLQDQVWKPVLDAMQAGKVVILPPKLEPIYGVAAVYAEPDGVEDVVAEFVRDSNAYIAQASRGQEFIASSYSRSSLINRIRTLTSSMTIT